MKKLCNGCNAGLVVSFFIIAIGLGQLLYPERVEWISSPHRRLRDVKGKSSIDVDDSKDKSSSDVDESKSILDNTSDLSRNAVKERRLFFCGIIAVSLAVLVIGSSVAVACKHHRRRAATYASVPNESDGEWKKDEGVKQGHTFHPLRNRMVTKGGVQQTAEGDMLQRRRTQQIRSRKAGYEIMKAREAALREKHEVWKRVRFYVIVVLLALYMVACIGLPRMHGNAVSCNRGFFWEMHMIFFSLFCLTKFAELFLYTFDPSVEGELDILAFTLKFVPSFVSYADGYMDSTSIAVAASCADQYPFAMTLSYTMTFSYSFGVVLLQWVIVLIWAVRDPSQASLSKLLHMDALASCLVVPEDQQRTWYYTCMARTFGEDLPQAIQQMLYLAYVKFNGIMAVSVGLSVLSGLKAIYDRLPKDVTISSFYERLMRLQGSEEVNHDNDDEALRILVDNYPYLQRTSHELRPWINECRKAFQNGETERAKDILNRIEKELEQEESKLEGVFNIFKPEGQDWLSSVELRKMLEFLGFPSSENDVEDLMHLADLDGDQRVYLSEFQVYVGRTGGLFKLFEIRRKEMLKRRMEARSGEDGSDDHMIRMELLSAGFGDEAQISWTRVLDRSEFEEAAKLNLHQKHAVRHIRQLAQNNHEAAMPELIERSRKLNFTDSDLAITLAFIRELAPLIIHVNLDLLLEHVEKDDHYRNQFETDASGGCLNKSKREQWERNLFGEAYEGAEPFERVKYGVLNTMNNKQGVLPCNMYGDSYMVLRDARLRCTCTPYDSSECKADKLAVLDYYGHVLNEYSDEELTQTILAAKSDVEEEGDGHQLVDYKEVQIHGEIDFTKHVKTMVASTRHREDPAFVSRLKAACEKHGIDLRWIDEEIAEAQKLQQRHLTKLWQSTALKTTTSFFDNSPR